MPRISFKKFRNYLLIFIISLTIFSSGYFLGFRGYRLQAESAKKITVVRTVPPDKSNLDFSLFWQVWDTIGAKYYDKTKIDNRAMIYGAIQGMVSAVGDPYTVFLPPNDNKVANEDLSGSFEGVGIQLGFRGNQLAVTAPLPGSPAEKAGVKPGDYIIGIQDEQKNVDRGTVGISLPEAVKIIRGKAGTKVTLILTREGAPEPITVVIERMVLDVPSVILTYVGDGSDVAHLQLLKFGSDTADEWDKKVSEILKKNNIKGVILDLRNNPGGYLESAVDISGEFLPTGSVGVIEEGANGVRLEEKTQRVGRLTNMPLVVLVNGGSASAAEILAGALRDNRKVKIVGETTFGKGSIQEPIDFVNGSGLHITIARWLTPSGFWVNEKGLKPDVEVKLDENSQEDTQLQEALKTFQ